ncbi:MAG: hypothetical protein FJW90_12395 [Actinobacteria bacterium]|nr:hypothetical protein [Actinomycetota bacterium]
MALSRDPPFFAGSILGVRAWVVQARLPSSAVRLGAAVASAVWEPHGEWTESVCEPPGGGGRRHRTPAGGCSCGLYALHPRPDTVGPLYGEHIALHGQSVLNDPCLVEMVGPIGIVEACGRVEVHEDGFRAERARPLALIAGAHWPAAPREAIAELAALYEAELLVAERPADVLELVRERGGALGDQRVEELLAPLRPPPQQAAYRPPRSPTPPSPTPPPTTPPPPATSPPPEPGRLERLGAGVVRVGQWLGQAAVIALVVLFSIAWYGGIAAICVMMAGGILFGWFGFDEEPAPRPAKVLAVRMDRERCVLSATIQARRKLEQLNVVVTGNLRNGDSLGSHRSKLGPLRKGRNQVVVVRPPRLLCRSRHHFTLRVRPVWKGIEGRPAEVFSRYRGPVRNLPPAATEPS